MVKISKLKKYIFPIIFFACCEVAAASFYPYIVSYLIDNFKSLNKNKIILISILFFLSVVLILLFAFLKKYFISRYKKKVVSNLRLNIFDSIIKSNYRDFHKHPFDYYSSFIENDINKIYTSYYENICYGYIRLFCNIVYLIILFLISWPMAIIILVSSVFIFVVPAVSGKKYEKLQLDLSETNANFLERTNEFFQSHDFINENNYSLFRNKYISEINKSKDVEYKYDVYNSFTQVFTGASLYIQMAIVFISGLVLAYFGVISFGILSAALIFTDLLSNQMNDISYIMLEIKTSKAMIKKYNELLHYQSKSSNECFDTVKNITIRDVAYKINDELQYKHLNYTFYANKKYAIIGKNGSGKSTLLKIIAKIIQPDAGEVLINDFNYSHSKQISYLSQENYIFDGNIYDNLTMMDKNFESHDESNSFIKAFNLIKTLNDDVGRNGSKLSGGEKAKICLIRELLRKPKILLLDEPFSAIDSNSKRDIEKRIYNMQIGIIEITHDTTLEHLSLFDCVIYIKDFNIYKVCSEKLSLLDFIKAVEKDLKL